MATKGKNKVVRGRQGDREATEEEKPGRKKAKTVIIETVTFIPYTPDSALKLLLQKADDNLSVTLNRPKIRFVERGGNQVVRNGG